jgi:hypothetical protein
VARKVHVHVQTKTWTSFSVDVLGAVDLETANFTVTFVTFRADLHHPTVIDDAETSLKEPRRNQQAPHKAKGDRALIRALVSSSPAVVAPIQNVK